MKALVPVLSAWLMAGTLAAPALATGKDDFEATTAQQLANLCRTQPDDPDYVAAIHFCEGFMVGAYRYHRAALDGPGARSVICLPEAAPSRDEAAAGFVAWLDGHPQYRTANAVETQFKWLTETWPCR